MDKNNSKKQVSKPVKEELKCPDCDQVFAHQRSLLRHDFAVHWGQKHVCNCGKQFPRKDSLKRHKRGCPGVLIQGTIVDITPYTRPVSSTQENTTSTLKAGHSLKNTDYIIRKTPKKVVIPWTPPSSSFFPKPAHLSIQAQIDRKKVLDRELFGEDTSPDQIRSPSPTTRLEDVDLTEDLQLSESSSCTSMELSDLDEPTPGTSAQADTTPVSAAKKLATLQDTLLEVLSDLTMVQQMAASRRRLTAIHEELHVFHVRMQDLIKQHL